MIKIVLVKKIKDFLPNSTRIQRSGGLELLWYRLLWKWLRFGNDAGYKVESNYLHKTISLLKKINVSFSLRKFNEGDTYYEKKNCLTPIRQYSQTHNQFEENFSKGTLSEGPCSSGDTKSLSISTTLEINLQF